MIEYGVDARRVIRLRGRCTFNWPVGMAFLSFTACEPHALVLERCSLCAEVPHGILLLADREGCAARIFVNDWAKVIDCEGRESLIEHGVYPADEFNRKVAHMSRAKCATDWIPT